jgi:RNA polymerase sigma-70 factor (ECF subfamily)
VPPGSRPLADDPPAGTVDFAAIYRDQVRYVWGTLRRLGARERDLEDLAHEVFVVAYRKLADYDRARPIRPWLFGIAFRVAAGERRRARHDREIATEHVDVADDAEASDEIAARRALCLKALAELPIEQRAVLILHDLDGFSAPEIAASLEVPLNTVYSRLRLGRAKFTMAARRLAGAGELPGEPS